MDDADITQERQEAEAAMRWQHTQNTAASPRPEGSPCKSCPDVVEPTRCALGMMTCFACASAVARMPRNLLGRRH